MKHKTALTMHLHRFQQLKTELNQRKDDALEELEHLNQLHDDTLTRISTRDDRDRDGSDTDQRARKSDNGGDMKMISQAFEQTRGRLRDLVAFFETKSAELSTIKSTFQGEYQEEEMTESAPLDDTDRDVYQKDAAIRKMTARLDAFSQSIHQKLDAGYDAQEMEELLSKLNLAKDRSRPRTKLPLTGVLPHDANGSTASRQKRASSLSKERLLNRAKQIRAAKEANPSSTGSAVLTSSPSWERISPANGQPENVGEDCKTSVSDGAQDKNQPLKPTDGNQNCGSSSTSDSKEPQAEIIQVQEVTSSVQENKSHMHNSFGESLTESSIMTSSTVSAQLGDSSLQTSSDHCDVKQSAGSDSSLDSVTPSVAEEASVDEHNSSTELAAKCREALLSRPRLSRAGSRYIQIGLPEPRPAWEGPPDLKVPSRFYRHPSFSPYARVVGRPGQGHYPLPLAHNPRRHVFQRSHSAHPAYRQPWYAASRGYLPPPHGSRRSQSSYPVVYPQDLNLHRGVDFQNGVSVLEATCPGSAVPSGGQVANWPREQQREGVTGRRNGVSSVGSSGSSGSPTPDNGSEGRSDEDVQDEVDGCPTESKTAAKGLVTVKLVTSDNVQRHRGPGLLDHRTQADCFMYPREKSLEELADFVHKRLKQYGRGRMRLWLFEEDEEGLFLPRRMLKGHFTKRSVGSLNLGTVTLFVQVAESRERLYAFDHHKVRFVFVKAPHWDTGEFVVKGHHQVDITKATRAVIQILKKKFMPQCPSSLKLYVETGGKKMYCIPHSAASTFDQDTERRSRHGDILVLLEDFIGQQTALGGASYLSQSQQDESQLVPLAPLSCYRQPCSKDSEGAASGSGGESVLTSDDQDDSPVCISPDSPLHEIDLGDGYHLHHQHGEDVEEGGGGEGMAEVVQPKPETSQAISLPHVNFIIPFDYTTSTSEDSLTSPCSEAKGPAPQNGAVHRRQLLQWNLTNNYMSRFSRIREEGESVTVPASGTGEGGPKATEAGHQNTEEQGAADSKVEYDSVEVSSSRIEMTSVEYESLVVRSIGEEILAQSDPDTSSSVLGQDTNRAAVHTTKVTEVLSSLQLTRNGQLVPAAGAVVVAAENEQDVIGISRQVKGVSVTSTEMAGSPNQKVVVATINISENKKRHVAGLNGNGVETTPSKAGDLNPVAPVFTPRTRLRMQQMGKRLDQNNVNDPDKAGKGKMAEEEKGFKVCHSVTVTPNTPHSGVSGNSVFTSDEDLSVYYTPAPAFVYPDRRRPSLQSTAIPLTDMNNSDSQCQLNPDQISAITNRSSSFMAVRWPRQPSVGVEQISAIPNISTSFMEIPSQHQLHNSSLPGHSTSISQRHSSSNDPSFVAPVSPRHPHTVFETSHLQANCSTLPVCPVKPNHRQAVHKGKPRKPERGNKKNYTNTTPKSEAPRPQANDNQPHAVPKSGATAVKQEDPAIMDVGKQVLVIAQKSSLNANATEFVPKETATPAQPPSLPQELGAQAGSVPVTKGTASIVSPRSNPFQQNTNPLAAKFFSCTTVNQQGVNRTVYQADMPKPSTFPSAPTANRITASNLYSTLKQHSGALTTFAPKPPILVSLTNGSRADLPPKPRPDTSRHVTFADPPIRNVKAGARRVEPMANSYNPRHGAYTRTPAPHVKPVHPSHGEPNGPSHKHETIPCRRKIGSGRFDDRPKRYIGETLRKNVQRQSPQFRTQASDPVSNPAQQDYRKYPPASSRQNNHYNGSTENDYTGGRYGQVYAGPPGFQKRGAPFGRRDHMGVYGSGEYPPPSSRHRTDHHYRFDYQPQGGYPYSAHTGAFPPHHRNGRFQAEERVYSKGQTFAQDPRPYNAYKPPRHPQTGGFRDRERGQARGRPSGPPHGIDFRFRRPIRIQHASNSSSDQSDSSLQNGRQNNPRFRRVSRPVHESETETSLSSVTFLSEGSNVNDSVAEQSSEVLAAAASPAENGSSGDSSGTKTSQSSASSRQSMRLRRGYIQLGLGNCGRPEITGSD